MLVECERCGAPQELPPGGAARCLYCGTTAHAPPARASLGAYDLAPLLRAPRLAQAPRNPWRLVLLGGVVGIAVIGSVLASSLPANRAVTANPAPVLQRVFGKVASPSIGWSTSDPGCLIDANGDGVSDVAGLTGASDLNQPTVIDGNSGAILFRAPALKKAEQLGCLGANAFFVVEGNFLVDFYTARSPWGKTAVMARDKVSAYGVGQGCVQLKTSDGTSQGIQLPSGVASTCPATLRQYYGYDEPGLIGLTDDGTELSAGARKYTMTKRASGTEILTVRVSEGPRQVWAKNCLTPPARSVRRSPSLRARS